MVCATDLLLLLALPLATGLTAYLSYELSSKRDRGSGRGIKIAVR